jgi:oligoendopeptidase F
MARKDVSGRDAFVQLYDELGASLRFRLEPDGEALTEGEVIALLRDPDLGRRARALESLLTTFARERLPLTAVMNALLLDHRMECELRAYPDPIAPTHLANEVAPAVVDAMMAAVERHYPVIQEFFRLKARLLGLDRMTIADVYAPTGTTAAVPFDDARGIVLDAFARFDPTFAATAAADRKSAVRHRPRWPVVRRPGPGRAATRARTRDRPGPSSAPPSRRRPG